MAKRTRLDINRLAQAAIEAAFEDEQPRRRRFSGMHAVAAGAALATAARFAAKKAPSILPSPPSLSGLAGSVRDKLADGGWIDDEDRGDPEDVLADEWEEPDEEEDEEDEDVDEAPDEEDEEEETPEDEGDDWEDDEGEDDDDDAGDDEGPQASDDEDWDDEEEEADEEEEPEEEPAPAIELGGSNGDGSDASSSGVPDLMHALSTHRRPPVMRRRRQNEVDPAGQPPKRPRKSKT